MGGGAKVYSVADLAESRARLERGDERARSGAMAGVSWRARCRAL